MRLHHAFSWILQILMAVAFFAAASDILLGDPEAVRTFQELGMEPVGRYLIGGLEVAAAFLLLTPFSIALGSLLSWGLMTGALIAHLTRLGFAGDQLGTSLLALTLWIASIAILYLRRDQIEFVRCMFECSPGHPGHHRKLW